MHYLWFLLYTSHFVASSCGGPPVASRQASFATHENRKYLKTLIYENTLIYSGNQTNIIIFLLESNKVVSNWTSSNTTASKQNLQSQKRLRRPQNDLAGCRDQAYHFQHQKLPLYAQSREPFHTGHGRPFVYFLGRVFLHYYYDYC